MLKDAYTTFFEALGDELDATAHSHHPWPDVTRAAHLQYWQDSARLTNRKWQQKVFGEAIPEAQGHIARHLGLAHPELIAFAPNTHEFVVRLYSALDWSRSPRVLTTTSEFHSFARQTRRLEETGRLLVSRIAVKPYLTFWDRFREALAEPYDLVFLSHVFFDSGFALPDLSALVEGIPPHTIVVVDGYHAFMAIPIDLGALGERIFYMAGGYKYAQAGEGACFMATPPGSTLRPAVTGWFSDFGRLSGAQGEAIGYGEGAMRFWGSTFDASGIYRLNAVMRLLADRGVTAHEIHAHVGRLQSRFLDGLAAASIEPLPASSLTPPAGTPRGNFLAFDLDRAEEAEARAAAHGIHVDRRGRRLRFGFGVYHDDASIDALLARLRTALA
jgi:selenocysteine lyase/cysteine desulfurase